MRPSIRDRAESKRVPVGVIRTGEVVGAAIEKVSRMLMSLTKHETVIEASAAAVKWTMVGEVVSAPSSVRNGREQRAASAADASVTERVRPPLLLATPRESMRMCVIGGSWEVVVNAFTSAVAVDTLTGGASDGGVARGGGGEAGSTQHD